MTKRPLSPTLAREKNQPPAAVDLSGFHPDTGVDRKALKQIKKRFLALNQVRLVRAQMALGERQQLFVHLLPLLFHVNHPMLPGFNGSDTPRGIPGFEPGAESLAAAKFLTRSFTYKKDLAHKRGAIDSLFMMGSVGTIAHSDTSDLDIWVCYKPGLKDDERAALQQKCELVSRWAETQLGVEAHFFLMCPSGQAPVDLAPMNAESSGSAQYHLLLDEFYRSAIWLAGKTPLWWWVPAEHETDYANFTEQMLKKRFVRKQDIIDFGPITHIPTNEFLGAGIWQLYKGIDSPHKSLLKLLLLESYALAPAGEPLALAFKREMYRAEPDANTLDAYLQIYRCIEQYLLASGQHERLDIARHCFYFKVDKPLTHKPTGGVKSWQRELLETITDCWQWDHAHLSHLDRRRLWKTPQVQKERDRLVAELSKSYRLLSGINRNAIEQAAISGRELSILGRKLHAAYERKAGKIERLNPGISQDLSEAYLAIERSDDNAPWRLYRSRHPALAAEEATRALLKEAGNLLEIIIWAYRNRILTRISQLTIREGKTHFSLREHELLTTIGQWLPSTELAADHQAFLEPATVTRQLIVINLGELPYPELHEKGLEKISSHSDALNYSGFKDNLIKRIDVASINSWHEIIVRGFTDNPLTEALLYYLRQTPPSARNKPPEIVIRCLSPQLSHVVTARAEEIWSDIAACYYTGTRPASTRYIFSAGEVYYVLQFHQDIPAISSADSDQQLLEILSRAQHHWSPIVVDRRSLQKHPLSAICANLHTPGSYLFYQVSDKGIVYTLVDPEGALWQATLNQQSSRAFLAPLLNFIRQALERLSADGLFAVAEDAVASQQDVYCYELATAESGEYYALAHSEKSLPMGGPFIDITVIAESRGEEIAYRLYCDEQPFVTTDEDVFTQAASYLYHHRRGEKHYHCYISDLDLTACADLIAPETGLRLIHYLQHKQMIEEQLNARLGEIE